MLSGRVGDGVVISDFFLQRIQFFSWRVFFYKLTRNTNLTNFFLRGVGGGGGKGRGRVSVRA